jgi:hypothetical protein
MQKLPPDVLHHITKGLLPRKTTTALSKSYRSIHDEDDRACSAHGGFSSQHPACLSDVKVHRFKTNGVSCCMNYCRPVVCLLDGEKTCYAAGRKINRTYFSTCSGDTNHDRARNNIAYVFYVMTSLYANFEAIKKGTSTDYFMDFTETGTGDPLLLSLTQKGLLSHMIFLNERV